MIDEGFPCQDVAPCSPVSPLTNLNNSLNISFNRNNIWIKYSSVVVREGVAYGSRKKSYFFGPATKALDPTPTRA